jgi:hypothetical protein
MGSFTGIVRQRLDVDALNAQTVREPVGVRGHMSSVRRVKCVPPTPVVSSSGRRLEHLQGFALNMTTLIKQDDLIESVAAALQYISYYHPVDFSK